MAAESWKMLRFPVETCNGSLADVWLASVERQCRSQGLPEFLWSTKASMHLEGVALLQYGLQLEKWSQEFLTAKGEECQGCAFAINNVSWSIFSTWMRATFLSRQHDKMLRKELSSLQCAPTPAGIYDYSKLFLEVLARFVQRPTDADLLDFYLESLPLQARQFAILHRNVTNWSEAATAAKDWFEVAPPQEISVVSSNSRTAALRRRSSSRDSDTISLDCFYCGRKGHVQRDCHRRQRDFAQQRPPFSSRGSRASQYPQNRSSTPPGACYNCGATGHFASRCPGNRRQACNKHPAQSATRFTAYGPNRDHDMMDLSVLENEHRVGLGRTHPAM